MCSNFLVLPWIYLNPCVCVFVCMFVSFGPYHVNWLCKIFGFRSAESVWPPQQDAGLYFYKQHSVRWAWNTTTTTTSTTIGKSRKSGRKKRVISAASSEANKSSPGKEIWPWTWQLVSRVKKEWRETGVRKWCVCLRPSERIKSCLVSPETTSGDLKKLPLLWGRLGSAETSCSPHSQLHLTKNQPLAIISSAKRKTAHSHTLVSCPACTRLLTHLQINGEE